MNKKFEARLRAEKRANDRLLPCPFCGGKPQILSQEYGLLVRCSVCSAEKKVFSNMLKQALAAWNWRNTDWIRMLTVHNIPGSMQAFELK